jgi:hypothetical protein
VRTIDNAVADEQLERKYELLGLQPEERVVTEDSFFLRAEVARSRGSL